MTYQQYIDLGEDSTFRHDIDPQRMVWVLKSKFNKTHYINSSPVEKAVVTTLYDAETGEGLALNVSSEDPHGMDKLKEETGRKSLSQ